jgi:alkyl hydroperoxide reductase subunit D
MSTVDTLTASLPEAVRDLRMNLQAVLREGALSPGQRWGVAIAAAIASRSPRLRDALLADAAGQVEPGVLEDARAAAALMGMNNVYYRFRHMVGGSYGEQPARLRMTRLARPATSKGDLELFSLAVSAINGCETCVRAHEAAVRSQGIAEAQIHDAVRIAATVHGAAVALEAAGDAEAA